MGNPAHDGKKSYVSRNSFMLLPLPSCPLFPYLLLGPFADALAAGADVLVARLLLALFFLAHLLVSFEILGCGHGGPPHSVV